MGVSVPARGGEGVPPPLLLALPARLGLGVGLAQALAVGTRTSRLGRAGAPPAVEAFSTTTALPPMVKVRSTLPAVPLRLARGMRTRTVLLLLLLLLLAPRASNVRAMGAAPGAAGCAAP